MNAGELQPHFELFGRKVRDKVTQFTGVYESVCFDLYGCIQVVVRPKVDDKGVVPEARFFDIARLEAADADLPVLPIPEFVAYHQDIADRTAKKMTGERPYHKGAAEKPARP